MGSRDTITLTGSGTGGTSPSEVTIPRELGPVRLLREIGRGGMGVVYLGRHQMLDRDVAVKFLLNAVAGSDDPGFAGFLEGARAAARLEHPGLTTIHHADVVDGIPYLVMQYTDGPALSEVLKQTGPLSLSALFAVLDAVSEAIGELHDRGIIHHDIKPGNVLLCLDGRVVVTDFGLALTRPLGQRGPFPAGLAGTPAYMAPEMFAGELALQSDVYALGIMTFELVTGELPFTGTVEEVREKHLHEPLPLEPLRRRRVDSAMIEVLERATHKNAMFRYKTARHFRSALNTGIMTDELLREGAAELQRLVLRAVDTEPDATTTEVAETTPTSPYFDRLTEIAEDKRATREPSDKGHAQERTQADRAEAPTVSPDDRPVAVESIPGEQSKQVATLVVDVPCAQCEYDLRGLSAEGRCPECGKPVALSLRLDRLLFAEPNWLRHIVRGLTLIYGASAATPVLFVVLVAVSSIPSTGNVAVLALAGPVAGVVLIVGLVLGSFFATAAEPQRHGGSIRWSSRRVVRALGILLALLLAAVAVTASYNRTLLIVTLGLLLVALLGMSVTFLQYLASLADRIPNARLVRQARGLAIAIGTFSIVGAAAGVTSFGFERTFSKFSGVMLVTFVVCLLGSVVTEGLYLGLMRLYRKGIKRVIAASISHDTLFGDVPTDVALAKHALDSTW